MVSWIAVIHLGDAPHLQAAQQLAAERFPSARIEKVQSVPSWEIAEGELSALERRRSLEG